MPDKKERDEIESLRGQVNKAKVILLKKLNQTLCKTYVYIIRNKIPKQKAEQAFNAVTASFPSECVHTYSLVKDTVAASKPCDY